MKIFFNYLRDHLKYILCIFIVEMSFSSVYFLYSIDSEIILYGVELSLSIVICFFIIDYIRYFNKHKKLQVFLKSSNPDSLDTKEYDSLIEKDYCDIIQELIKNNRSLVNKTSNDMTELKDYYAIWAHQIKTPIAAMNLLLQIMDNKSYEEMLKDVPEMKQQMFKIDFYVDAVMNYLRLDDLSSDFKFEYFSLKLLVNKSVKKFASQFIGKHISITLDNLDNEVCSDVKWLGFIIEQLLSNAIKYTKEGGNVKIYTLDNDIKDSLLFVIEDNGIGISKEDIPRIMERGYTGLNGRSLDKSSGIGLYLCNKAAQKLGIDLSIESELNIGTKVFLRITQKYKQHE